MSNHKVKDTILHTDATAMGVAARAKGKPIWVNPFIGTLADCWRRGYQQDQPVVPDEVKPFHAFGVGVVQSMRAQEDGGVWSAVREY